MDHGQEQLVKELQMIQQCSFAGVASHAGRSGLVGALVLSVSDPS